MQISAKSCIFAVFFGAKSLKYVPFVLAKSLIFMLKRKIISDLERWRHKGDACLGFTPQIEICGDPLTDKAGGYRLWVMGNGYEAISALTANLLR